METASARTGGPTVRRGRRALLRGVPEASLADDEAARTAAGHPVADLLRCEAARVTPVAIGRDAVTIQKIGPLSRTDAADRGTEHSAEPRTGPDRLETRMPETTRVLWSGLVQILRRVDAFTLKTFNPHHPSSASRR